MHKIIIGKKAKLELKNVNITSVAALPFFPVEGMLFPYSKTDHQIEQFVLVTLRQTVLFPTLQYIKSIEKMCY